MADEKPKHKPSPKRTLEEVLKSLQDLIRNDLVSGRGAESRPPPPSAPPAASAPDAFDQALDRLDELITHELLEPARHAQEAAQPKPEEILPGEPEWPPEESAEAADVEPFPPPAESEAQARAKPVPAEDDRTETENVRFGVQDRLPFEEPPPSLASFLRDEPSEESKAEPASSPAPPAQGPHEEPQPATGGAAPAPGPPPEETVHAGSDSTPDDGIPVLNEVVAELEPAPEAVTPATAREIAIRVVARLNIERRKAGEPPLDIRTIERLQNLLKEALARGEPPTGG